MILGSVASEGLMSHRRLSSEPTKFPKCSARLSKSAQVFRSSNGEVCWSHPPERALSHKWWHELDTWQANVTWCLARWFHVACLQKWHGGVLPKRHVTCSSTSRSLIWVKQKKLKHAASANVQWMLGLEPCANLEEHNAGSDLARRS